MNNTGCSINVMDGWPMIFIMTIKILYDTGCSINVMSKEILNNNNNIMKLRLLVYFDNMERLRLGLTSHRNKIMVMMKKHYDVTCLSRYHILLLYFEDIMFGKNESFDPDCDICYSKVFEIREASISSSYINYLELMPHINQKKEIIMIVVCRKCGVWEHISCFEE